MYKATAAELADLGINPEANATGAAALRLATELDAARDSKEAAAAARELRQAMAAVRGMAAPRETGDRVDELAARAAQRAARRPSA
ncbi:hypothetical protein [Streptomyces sp. C10-9-1]|uniref:hypothetical protein n=1 Tax=Streptomyces sp. C10-9-1 TaxID=1859285 RepID=UPI003D70EAE3